MEQTAKIEGTFKIQKSDDDKRLAFGWASVAQYTNGIAVVDSQADIIEPQELEQAAYNFVHLS